MYKPTTKDELSSLIWEELKKQGPDADLNHIDTSLITDMSYLFENCNIRNIKIDRWNVSNVTNMSRMFFGCTNFNSDLSEWNVSNVKNMYAMFSYCRDLFFDLSYWYIVDDTNVENMFFGCPKMDAQLNKHVNPNKAVSTVVYNRTLKPTSRKELRCIIVKELRKQGPDADLNHIDTSLITSMFRLFEGLNVRNIKVDGWDTSNVTDMDHIFHGCSYLDCDLSTWDLSKVKTMTGAFDFCCIEFNKLPLLMRKGEVGCYGMPSSTSSTNGVWGKLKRWYYNDEYEGHARVNTIIFVSIITITIILTTICCVYK